MTLLQNGIELLNRVRNDSMGESVTYKRGSATVAVTAARGQTQYTSISEDGFEVGCHITDFLIEAEDLILSGAEVQPAAGDIIQTEFGKFEVSRLANENCWRYSDSLQTTYRIHTKRVI